MPELPEVEILRRGLTKYLTGLTVSGVNIRFAKIFSGKEADIIGSKVKGVRRFGKMLAIDLSSGKSLAVHVKMTGRLIYRGKKQPKKLVVDWEIEDLPNKHTHVIFTFKNGDVLYYNDVRKFGWIKVVATDAVEKLPFVAKLGPEPFRDLSEEKLVEILHKYSRPIKTLIMDQSRISGVGNIYANEALHCARISPEKKSNKISKQAAQRLNDCILKVLKEGIKFGGSSTDSFRDVLGKKGKYQKHYEAYDREGETCERKKCKGKIRKIKMSGRGTYFCPVCQK